MSIPNKSAPAVRWSTRKSPTTSWAITMTPPKRAPNFLPSRMFRLNSIFPTTAKGTLMSTTSMWKMNLAINAWCRRTFTSTRTWCVPLRQRESAAPRLTNCNYTRGRLLQQCPTAFWMRLKWEQATLTILIFNRVKHKLKLTEAFIPN